MGDSGYYAGEFVDGEIQGEGERYWGHTGDVYRGSFVEGEMSGKGIMKYGDGRCYDGNWTSNKYHGTNKCSPHEQGSLF